MACPRCEADPQPAHFANPRHCAFDSRGYFTPSNWNCATIDALLDGYDAELYGDNETMQIVLVRREETTEGWVTLTRYKQRGQTSSAVHVGDFWPPVPLSLALAELMLSGASA